MAWRCFRVAPSEFCRRSLRRYGRSAGAAEHYHDASVVIDDQFLSPDGNGRSTLGEEYRNDSRWPLLCTCGHAFTPDDHFQMNEDRLYKGCPDGKLYPLRELPPGAIWHAWWMDDIKENPYAGPDGKVWALMLPAGVEWLIYGPASGGGKWTVTGELPKITVAPSIHQVGHYHGFVKDGIVTDDCEGRKFPKFPATA